MITLFNLLISDLKKFKFISFSTTPNEPQSDELLKREYISHELINTVTGSLLIISAKNPETQKVETNCFSDIVEVAINESSTATLRKYYLESTNRFRKHQIDKIDFMLKNGQKLSPSDEKVYTLGHTDTYRIFCINE